MPPDAFLHERSDFKALVETVADAEKINDPALVEKDYWIMHAVFGLKQLGLTFELKGGTSLSKGFGIIHRFSEDIDIRIEPFDGLQVDTNPNHEKPQHIGSRQVFYEKLRDKVKIPGITAVERDTTYDDETHGEDDQIVPIGAAALQSAKLVKGATLKFIRGSRMGCPQPPRTRSIPICSRSLSKDRQWQRKRDPASLLPGRPDSWTVFRESETDLL
jgi:hypothetical protein